MEVQKFQWTELEPLKHYGFGSELLLLNNIVRSIGRHFGVVASLGNNELLIIKNRPIADTILLNIDMTINNNSGVRMKLQRLKR